ncbi:MAG TPA: L,D-transpeptidase family protein [Allosphingosinicella sp.]
MTKLLACLASAPALLFLGSAAPPPRAAVVATAPTIAAKIEALALSSAFDATEPASIAAPEPVVVAPPPPPPPLPPTPEEAREDGVLIVVSLASQRMFVFRDGALWDSSKVSTGRRGMDTPVGTFPILQKKVDHRSNLYDDAPMPFMQRLTWGGVALHAGRVPNYPASHGCIRMPKAFAKKLYSITDFSSTVVVVTDERAASAKQALEIA